MTDNETIAANRAKIYEKLNYNPQPDNYVSEVPWIVQQQISATNGIHYGDRVGKLKHYPIYELPVPSISHEGVFLDIGCGWGRWLVAAKNKGYIPIGIDLRLEFCESSRKVLSDLHMNGYTVVADLENIPFKDNIFDLIWSFSVIQHTHYKRLTNCLNHINRILTPTGFTRIEFPNKKGLRNRLSNVKYSKSFKDDYNSWCVRYYAPEEYKSIFEKYLNDFSYSNHSFLGIGVLKEDLKYVSLKNKLLCAVSLFGSSLTHVIPGLKQYSDSIYISAKKRGDGSINDLVSSFKKAHLTDPKNNLNIIPLLKCPKYGVDIELSSDKKKAISKNQGIYYPIENGIPIMIVSESRNL